MDTALLLLNLAVKASTAREGIQRIGLGLLAVLEGALEEGDGGGVESEGVLEARGAVAQQLPQPDQRRTRGRRRQQLRVMQPHQQRRCPAHQLHLGRGAGKQIVILYSYVTP